MSIENLFNKNSFNIICGNLTCDNMDCNKKTSNIINSNVINGNVINSNIINGNIIITPQIVNQNLQTNFINLNGKDLELEIINLQGNVNTLFSNASIQQNEINLNSSNISILQGNINTIENNKLNKTTDTFTGNLNIDGNLLVSNIITTNDFILNNNRIHLGINSGSIDQGSSSIALGLNSGYNRQGKDGFVGFLNQSIAIGINSGYWNQNSPSIAIGRNSGYYEQKMDSICIGRNSGNLAGINSINIGSFSGDNNINNYNNYTIINSSGSSLNANGDDRFFINPVRNNITGNVLYYNTTTKEVSFGSISTGSSFTVSNISTGTTAIPLMGTNTLTSANAFLNITGTGAGGLTAVSVNTTSDERLKKDIQDLNLNDSIDLIKRLKPKQYKFNNNDDKLRYGLIAQDVKELKLNNNSILNEDSEYYSLNYIELISPIIKVLQYLLSE